MPIKLSDLPPDIPGYILRIGVSDDQIGRLRDLGICSGAEILRLYTAPASSPIAFLVKGAVISLRTDDCRRIEVETHGKSDVA